ncbi:hypothetical protein D3C78_1056540 [compost metagenome]
MYTGGDGQLVARLDGVFSRNRPFGLFVICVCTRSPNTGETEGSGTNVSKQDGTDRTVLGIRVITAKQVRFDGTELTTNNRTHADVVRVGVSVKLRPVALRHTKVVGACASDDIFKFFNRYTGIERTRIVSVTHSIETRTIGAEVVNLTIEAIIPPVQELTNLQTTELNKCLVNRNRASRTRSIVCVATETDEATQSAEFGVSTSVNFELSACEGIPVRAAAIGRRGCTVRVAGPIKVDLEADIALELQAGFGAGDVEEAGAESVADANVFQGLRLSSDDSVGSVSAGYCCESRSGADEKALDVHG